MTTHSLRSRREGALSRYVNTPRTYKVLVVLVVYLVFYLGVALLIGWVAGDRIDDDNVVADARSVFLALALPTLIGAASLLVFARRVGWLSAIFGRQPVRGSWWMWGAPFLVFAAIAGHVAQISGDRLNAADLAAFIALGVGVGLAEEVATRGVAVKMLRDAGHGERFVAVGSSLLFALMHSVNLFAGMSVKTVVSTILYTFGFGMCMYLTMRVTGTIWAAILLHGLTDPTTTMATGALDRSLPGSSDVTTAMLVAAIATFGLIAFGVVASFLVRGRAQQTSPLLVALADTEDSRHDDEVSR